VIVLTWNRLEITKKFFESLLSCTHLNIKIIVVDNASTDGTKEYLRDLEEKLADKIKVIYNKENVGFVRGVNQGFGFSTSAYVCLANNDLIFTKGWLNEIVGLFERYKSIGILNPNSNTLGVCPKKEGQIEGLADDLKRKYNGVFMRMPFCSGFCMVMRRDIMDKNGGLSNDYAPMFFEDTDICMKAKEMGYLIGAAKGAYVWHKEHGSFKEGDESDKIFKRNLKIFQEKWGKILKIAWIEDNYQDLLGDLRRVIIERQSDNITVYIRGIDVIRKDIFKSLNAFECSGVSFKKFNNYFGLVWSIKKKRFDLIISKNKFLRLVLGMIGQRTAIGVDDFPLIKGKRRGE
jgi:GT2 family glycosyltransferase